MGMQVPKMILQPIVENSINHGLEAKIEPGRIFIDITHTERTVCIRVDDDGVGIPAINLIVSILSLVKMKVIAPPTLFVGWALRCLISIHVFGCYMAKIME